MRVAIPDEVLQMARVYKVLEQNNGGRYDRKAKSPQEHLKRLDEMARLQYRMGEIVSSIILRDDTYTHRQYKIK